MSLTSIDLYETDGLLLFRSKSNIFQMLDLWRFIEKAENIFNFYLDFNWEFEFVSLNTDDDYPSCLEHIRQTGKNPCWTSNTLLNETGIEYLSMSQPLIREPYLIKRWMDGDTRPALCVSCNSCYRTPGHACRHRTPPPRGL